MDFLCETLCILCGSLCNKNRLHRVSLRRHREPQSQFLYLFMPFLSRVTLKLISNPIVLLANFIYVKI